MQARSEPRTSGTHTSGPSTKTLSWTARTRSSQRGTRFCARRRPLHACEGSLTAVRRGDVEESGHEGQQADADRDSDHLRACDPPEPGNAATAPRSAPVAGMLSDAPMRNTIAREAPRRVPEDQRPGQRGQRQELRCCVATEGHLQCIDEARIGGECDTSPDRRRGPTRQTVMGVFPGSASNHAAAAPTGAINPPGPSAVPRAQTGGGHQRQDPCPQGVPTLRVGNERHAALEDRKRRKVLPKRITARRHTVCARRTATAARSRPAAPGSGGRHLGGAPLHHASLRTQRSELFRDLIRGLPANRNGGPGRSAAAQMPPTSRPPGSRVHGSAAGRCR